MRLHHESRKREKVTTLHNWLLCPPAAAATVSFTAARFLDPRPHAWDYSANFLCKTPLVERGSRIQTFVEIGGDCFCFQKARYSQSVVFSPLRFTTVEASVSLWSSLLKMTKEMTMMTFQRPYYTQLRINVIIRWQKNWSAIFKNIFVFKEFYCSKMQRICVF